MNNSQERSSYQLWGGEETSDGEPEEDSIWIRRSEQDLDTPTPDNHDHDHAHGSSPLGRWMNHVRQGSSEEVAMNPLDLQQHQQARRDTPTPPPYKRNHISGEDSLYNGDHRSHSIVDSPRSESSSHRASMYRRQQRESATMAQIRLRKRSHGLKSLPEFDNPKDEVDPGDDRASFFAKVSLLIHKYFIAFSSASHTHNFLLISSKITSACIFFHLSSNQQQTKIRNNLVWIGAWLGIVVALLSFLFFLEVIVENDSPQNTALHSILQGKPSSRFMEVTFTTVSKTYALSVLSLIYYSLAYMTVKRRPGN